ncbi:ATP-binding cassette domain-containing protein [Streptomyces sp. NPDC001933]|uniref:ABC transporter ATP-binding protein n=1 Tax=Streptomyces sp. NPDC001933 TaxID=3364626 RepID=UPI00367FA484
MIEVEGLSYRYASGSAALQDLNFQVGPGEVFGFLGPSGAGKSTTQKILIRLLKPYTGQVRVMGRELREQGPEYYERIGVGFELPNHFMKLTALENLRFFASFYGATADPRALLAKVGLEEYADHRIDQFSKGMKMRLCFVRAVLHDPQVLFLDEPTSGLDPVNARLLKDLVLQEKARGKTVFLTTHNMHDAAELCDRVAFLVDGEIRLTGSPKELCAEGARRRLTVEYEEGDTTGSREFPLDSLGEDQEFLELLRSRRLVSVHSQEPTLEDVFVEATGRRLM